MLKKLFRRPPVRPAPLVHAHPPAGYAAPPSLVDQIPDSELAVLNSLLSWSAFTLDRHGRRFGAAHSQVKRTEPQVIPDRRIVEFDRRYGLRGRRVLEIGCFEGIHSVALAQTGAVVTAVDSRIENVVKTAVRCAMYGASVQVGCWDVEQPAPAALQFDWDFVHHVGVLYHLMDPIAHLAGLLPRVSRGLMLDTHVAPDNTPLKTFESGGKQYRFHPYQEGGRKDPFSGMYGHAKWLVEAELVSVLAAAGLQVEVAERRDERNGPRVLIFAHRNP